LTEDNETNNADAQKKNEVHYLNQMRMKENEELPSATE